MKKLALLLAFVVLAGLGPPERMLLTGYSPAREEAFIQSQSPTADLNIPALEVEVGPIVHLLMEDNAASTAVVNKANVAINGTASANTNTFTTATGKILRGLAFVVATSHLIDMGSDVIGTGADSACMWVNPASVAVGVDQYLISNGKFILYINDPGANALGFTSDGATVITGGTGISAGAFSHVCVVRDAAGAATIYLNGTADNATAASGSPTGGTGNVFIGNRADGAKDFGGTLDDVRIYNYALSPAQISAIYNNGAGHQNLASKAKANMITADAQRRVSSVVDKQGVEFYQSTLASQSVLTRSDNRENLLSYSEQIDQWTASAASVSANAIANPYDGETTADKIIEDSSTGTHYYRWNLRLTAGAVYHMTAWVKAAERTCVNLQIFDGTASYYQFINLATGAAGTASKVTSFAAEDAGDGWWKVTIVFNACLNSGDGYALIMTMQNISTYSYAGDGSSGLYAFGLQLRSSLADPSYLATTDHAQFRGMAGKQALRFDGVDDVMVNPATLGDLLAASSKTILLSKRLASTADNYYFVDSGDKFGIFNASVKDAIFNYDGNYDTQAGAASTINPQLLAVWHDGTTEFLSTNNGIIYSKASGATNPITGTLRFGAGTSGNYVNGLIQRLTTFKKVLSPYARDRISKHLCRQAGASCN